MKIDISLSLLSQKNLCYFYVSMFDKICLCYQLGFQKVWKTTDPDSLAVPVLLFPERLFSWIHNFYHEFTFWHFKIILQNEHMYTEHTCILGGWDIYPTLPPKSLGLRTCFSFVLLPQNPSEAAVWLALNQPVSSANGSCTRFQSDTLISVLGWPGRYW